jgi:hypothetical protein
MGDHVVRQDDAETPVRTEPHPTSLRCLVYEITPTELVDQLTDELMGGHITRQDDAGSPVRTEPHLTSAVTEIADGSDTALTLASRSPV